MEYNTRAPKDKLAWIFLKLDENAESQNAELPKKIHRD